MLEKMLEGCDLSWSYVESTVMRVLFAALAYEAQSGNFFGFPLERRQEGSSMKVGLCPWIGVERRLLYSEGTCSVTQGDEGAKLALSISIIALRQDGRRSDLYRKCSLRWR